MRENADIDVEKEEQFFNAGRTQNNAATMEISVAVPKKARNRSTTRSSCATLGNKYFFTVNVAKKLQHYAMF